MLLERINYYHADLHFSTDFSNVASEAPHYHKEAEITLVLQGSVNYRIYYQDFHITAGNMLVVDSNDLHYIKESSDDVIMLTSYIDLKYFSDIYPYIDFMIFICDELNIENAISHQKMQNKVSLIVHDLAEMMILSQNINLNKDKMKDKLLEIIHIMVHGLQVFFIENKSFKYGKSDFNSPNFERLLRIMSYLYSNYDKNITLNDLSEFIHLSTYHISHLIKDTTGLGFYKLLNFIRLEAASKLLNENTFTLTEISERCGFSSAMYFNKCFKEWYDITPSEYRKAERPTIRKYHGAIDRDKAFSLLEPYIDIHSFEKNKLYESYLPYPIFISLEETYRSEYFQAVFPMNILIDSENELKQLLLLKDDILELQPHSVIISKHVLISEFCDDILYKIRESGLNISITDHILNDNILSITADNMSQAFTKIRFLEKRYIRLCGNYSSLFSERGFPTVYYQFYKATAPIRGKADIHKKHITVYDKNKICIILNNASVETEMRYKLKWSDSIDPKFMITTSYEDNPLFNKEFTSIIKSKLPKPVLRNELKAVISGKSDMIVMKDFNKEEIMILQPKTLAVIKIFL